VSADEVAADSAHLTAHALARVLLEGPDIKVFFEDALGSAPVVGVSVNGDVLFIDGEPVTPYTTGEGGW
jgi:hypothetical protein